MERSCPHTVRAALYGAALLSLAVWQALAQEPPAAGQSAAAAHPATAVSEEASQSASAADPQFQVTQEQVADSLMGHQRYQAAIEHYRQANPMTSDTWNKMGVAYQMLFDNHDAEECYRKSLKLNPKNPVALNNLGSIYMSMKQYASAERVYRKAIKLDSKTALYHKNLGTAYLADRRYKKGWRSYQDALALDPQIFEHSNSLRVQNPSTVQDRGAMNFYMAKGCVKAGMPDKAIYYLRLALNEGFVTPKKIMADAEFAVLYDNRDFQQMLAAQGVYLSKDLPHAPAQP